MHEPQSSAVILRAVRDEIARRGADPSAYVPASTAGDADRTIGLATLDRLMRNASIGLGAPLFSFHVGLRVPTTGYDILGYLHRNAHDLRQVIQLTSQYQATMSTGAGFSFEELSDGRLLRRWTYSWNEPLVACEHSTIAAMLATYHTLIGESFIEEVWLTSPPVRPKRAAALLGTHIRWDARCNGVVLRPSDLDRRIPTGDDRMLELLRLAADHALRTVSTDSAGLADEVRRVLVQHPQDQSLGFVARTLAMAPRTLQRHLADRGTSFTDLVDDVRGELARNYLQESDATIAAIASRLGFSEPSAFRRAFRRWTGESPSAWRDRHA